jgi:hypothetical protein
MTKRRENQPKLKSVMRQHPITAGGKLYLNCPRCGLTIAPRADWLTVEHCPRCIARSRAVVRLFASPLPTDQLYTSETKPSPDRLTKLDVRAQTARDSV